MNKNLLVLLTITILSGIALSSTFVSADNNEVIDTVELIVPVACTMSGTGTTHTATLNPGTYSGESGSEYENGIGKTTLTAICNDDNGFSIYAIGYTGDEYGVTNLIGSNTNGTIATKAYASGDTTSNWSMKLTKVTDTSESYNPQNLTISTGYDNWIAVPATYTKVAQYKANTGSSTTDTTLGVKLETTYAAYIASNQAADTYAGQVKYTMVHPYDAATPIIPKTIADATTMQEVNTCPDTLTSGQIYTLIDSRDQQEYKVAKLADGKCWMVENLALDPTDSTTAANMNATNTNASAVAIDNYLNGGGGMAGWSSTAVSNNTLVHWSSNDYTEPLIDNQYKGTSITGYGPASNDGQAEAGIYYNYCAATAGTYCYDRGNGIDLPDTNIDAPEDICPANWRMPTGGDESEYEVLFNEYNTTQDATNVASLQYNWSATLSGYRLYNFEDRGYIGHWWSSTYSFGSFMNALHISNSEVNSYSEGRYMGYSVRCLLKTN